MASGDRLPLQYRHKSSSPYFFYMKQKPLDIWRMIMSSALRFREKKYTAFLGGVVGVGRKTACCPS
jgi:hypothetical protein